MGMAQAGVERSIDLKESGQLVFGGGMFETVQKVETALIAEGLCLTETVSKAEDVIITNV